MTDLAELKRLAEAAIADLPLFSAGKEEYFTASNARVEASLEFQRFANPATILALIAEVERLRAEVDRLGRDESEMLLIAHLDGKHRGKVEAERAAFRRGIEAAAKVAEGWETISAGSEYMTNGNGRYWDAGTPYDQSRQDAAAAIRAIGEE